MKEEFDEMDKFYKPPKIQHCKDLVFYLLVTVLKELEKSGGRKGLFDLQIK